jgi:hypothetical protein
MYDPSLQSYLINISLISFFGSVATLPLLYYGGLFSSTSKEPEEVFKDESLRRLLKNSARVFLGIAPFYFSCGCFGFLNLIWWRDGFILSIIAFSYGVCMMIHLGCFLYIIFRARYYTPKEIGIILKAKKKWLKK